MASFGALVTIGFFIFLSANVDGAFQWLKLPTLPCIQKVMSQICLVQKVPTQSVPKVDEKIRIEPVPISCPPGYSLKEKTCTKVVCPSAEFEIVDGQCRAKLPTCKENQILIGSQCHDKPEPEKPKCQPGFQFKNNTCVSICEAGFKFEINSCVKIIIINNTNTITECPQYFKLEGKNCVRQQCPKFSRLEGNDCVQCPSGQQGEGSKCVDIIAQTCGNQLVKGFCTECQAGFERKGNACVLKNCDEGFKRVGIFCQKILQCETGWEKHVENNIEICKKVIVECGEHYVRSGSNQCVLKCENGYQRIDNKCVLNIIWEANCPPNYKQVDKNKCVHYVQPTCPKEFEFVAPKLCVQKITGVKECPPKFQPDTSGNTCTLYISASCPEDFFFNNTECVKTTLIGSKCPENYVRSDNACIKKDTSIECPASYKKVNKTCVRQESIIQECPAGFVLLADKKSCEKVKESTECPEGYRPTGFRSCLKIVEPNNTCPDGYTLLEKNKCVRKIHNTNETLNATINCPKDYKLNNKSVCEKIIEKICPEGYHFNENHCVKQIKIGSCPEGFTNSSSDPEKCERRVDLKCREGYRLSEKGECVKILLITCPKGFSRRGSTGLCYPIELSKHCEPGYAYFLNKCYKVLHTFCPPGYKMSNSSAEKYCVRVSPSFCSAGYIRKNEIVCEKVETSVNCSVESVRNNDTRCVNSKLPECLKGFELDKNGLCNKRIDLHSQCPPSYTQKGRICERIINPISIHCPSGLILNVNKCEEIVPLNQTLKECPKGFVLNNTSCHRYINPTINCSNGFDAIELKCIESLLLTEKAKEKPIQALCPLGYIAKTSAANQRIECIRIIPKCPHNYELTNINNVSICRLRQCGVNETSHLVEGKLTCFRRPANECQPGFHHYPVGGQLVCISNGNKTCPIGTKLVKGIQSDYCEKIICDKDLVLIDGKCIKSVRPLSCKSGYIRIKNNCVEKICPRGFSIRHDKNHSICEANRFCPEGFSKIDNFNSTCIRVNCLDGYKRVGQICEKIAESCPKDEILEDGKCKPVCPKDHERRFGVCFPSQCPSGFKKEGNRCIKVIELGKCRPGFILVGQKCERNCSAGYIPKNDICRGEVCKEGFSLKGKVCVLNQCPEDSIRQGNYCYKKCREGFIQKGNVCVGKNGTCPTDFVMIGGSCFRENCPEGFEKVKNNCVKKCPEGFTPDANHTKCIGNNKCPPNYVSEPNSDQCVKVSCREHETLYQGRCYPTQHCPTGYKFNGVACEQKITLCPVGYLQLNGKHCVKFTFNCPKGEYAHGEKCVKECPKSYITINDRCQEPQIKCNDTKVSSDGQCLENCPKNFVRSNGVCHQCPEGSEALENKCTVFEYRCPRGYSRLGTNKCVQVCPEGFGFRHGYCLPHQCPKNQTPEFDFITKQITCQNDVNCAANKSLHENQCVDNCPAGLESARTGFRQKLVCRKPCSKEETYFRGKCENTLCLGKFKIQNSDKCEFLCPEGYIGVGKECQPIQILSCPAGYVLFNSKYCVRSCPEGFKSDSGACHRIPLCTANNTVQFNNTCVKECPKDHVEKDRICVQTHNCSNDLIFFNNQCVQRCPDTHYFESHACHLKPVCSKNFVDLLNHCVNQCPLGYRKEDNVCRRSKHCLHGEVKSGECVLNCPVGYRSVQGICQAVQFVCKFGQFLIVQDNVQKCVEHCPKGYESLRSQRVCQKYKKECPKGFKSQVRINPKTHEAEFFCQKVQYCSDGYLEIRQKGSRNLKAQPQCIKLEFPHCPKDSNIFIVQHRFYCLNKSCSKEYQVSNKNCSTEHCPSGFVLKTVGSGKFCHLITSEGDKCPPSTKRSIVYKKSNTTTARLGFVCLNSTCESLVNGTCKNPQTKPECPANHVLIDNSQGQHFCQANKTECENGFKAIFDGEKYTCQDSTPSCPAGYTKKYFSKAAETNKTLSSKKADGKLLMVCLQEKCLVNSTNTDKCEKKCPDNYHLQTSKSGLASCHFTCPPNTVQKINWSWQLFRVGAQFSCVALPPCPLNRKRFFKRNKKGKLEAICIKENQRGPCPVKHRMHKYVGNLIACLPQGCSAQKRKSIVCGPKSVVCPKNSKRVPFEKDLVACKPTSPVKPCPFGTKAVEEVSSRHEIKRHCVPLPKASCQSNEKQILTYFLGTFHFICLNEKCRYQRTTKDVPCQGTCPEDYEKKLFAPYRYFCVSRPKPLCPQGMSWLIQKEKASNSTSCMKIPGPSCPRGYNRLVYEITLESLSPFVCLSNEIAQKVLSQKVEVKPEEILCPQGYEVVETGGKFVCKQKSLHPNCPASTRQIIVEKSFYCLPENCTKLGDQCNATCPVDFQLAQTNTSGLVCTKKPSPCSCKEVLFQGKCISKPECGEDSKLVILEINNELKFKCEDNVKVCDENKIYSTSKNANLCQLSCEEVVNPSVQRRICLPQPANQCVCREGYASIGSRCVEPHKCARYGPIDMVFAIEGNINRVSQMEFSLMKTFVLEFLTGFSISSKAIRVGLVISGQNPPIVVNTHEITTKAELFELLQRLSLKNESKVDNILEALQIAANVLLSQEGGARSGVHQLLYVFTKNSAAAQSIDKQKINGAQVIIINAGSEKEADITNTNVKFVSLNNTNSVQLLTELTEKHSLCPLGYKSENGKCVDINECSNTNTCLSNSICVNTPGKYVCFCKDGLRYDSVVGCTDKEVCTIKTCPRGFKLNNDNKCVDINECEETVCFDDALCTNFEGGFNCTCTETRKRYNKNFGCVDIDECKETPNLCVGNAQCVSLPNGYKCTCKEGFNYTATGCVDINECASSTPPCRDNSTCANEPGSFRCDCGEGFTYIKDKCVDIDECQLEKKVCSGTSTCVNKIGSYECECPKFYLHYKGEGCVLDKNFARREADFVFLIDSSDAAIPVFKSITAMVKQLILKYNENQGLGLDARVALVQMSNSSSSIPLGFEPIDSVANRIEALNVLGGNIADMQIGLDRTIELLKSKGRPNASFLTFLITCTELPLRGEKLDKIITSTKDLKTNGQLVTIHIGKDASINQWGIIYKESEIRRYVFVIQYPEIISSLSSLLYENTIQLIQCPANYVKQDGICKVQVELGTYCRVSVGGQVDVRPLGSQWTDRCSIYRCDETGVTVVQHKCLGYDAKCYDLSVPGSGKSVYFPCMQVGGQLNWKCRCVLANNSLVYESITWKEDNIETKDGKQCSFPFLYQNEWCYSCQPYSEEMWCSLERDYAINRRWSYCAVKRALNKCTDPFTNKVYEEDQQWSVIRNGTTSCDQMSCTKVGAKKIPRCQSSTGLCVNYGTEDYKCNLENNRYSDRCLCSLDSNGWGKNEDFGGSKSVSVGTEGSELIRTCLDASTNKEFKLNATWENECFTYRCDLSGATTLSMKCKGQNNICYDIGAKNFSCIINNNKYENCACEQSSAGNPILMTSIQGQKITMEYKKTDYQLTASQVKIIENKSQNIVKSANNK